ncbi:hypothetical protein PHYPSEUDO_012616, partial [Phytophthora pseudosyringae]
MYPLSRVQDTVVSLDVNAMRRGRELDDVSVALADVQARQRSLAQGSVLPRASSPPPSGYAPLSPRPPPVSKDKAQRATPFQWLKRRVVRRSDRKENGALEDLGSLELVPSASLATVRALMGQFIALPPRRAFAFVHPTTNAQVDAAEEMNVRAGDLPFICIVLLPGKEPPGAGRGDSRAVSAAAAGAETKEDQRRLRPETAHVQPPPHQEQKLQRPRTVEARAKQRQVATSTASAATSSGSRLAGDLSGVKRERSSLDVVGTGREQQGVLPPSKEVSQQTRDESKTEAVPLHTQTKVAASKRATAEAKQFVPESKRASSAGLTAGSILKPSQAKIGGQDVTEKQASAPVERRTSIRVPREHTRSGDKSTAPADTETAHVAQEEDALESIETGESSLSNLEQAHEDVSLQQPVSIDPATAECTPDVSSCEGNLISQTPGQLRRCRRFKERTAAKLSETSWSSVELGQQEIATDEEVEEFLQAILEIVRTGLEGVEARQLDASLLYYGIDCHALELHELLIALDSELGTRCAHVRGGVDGQLKQYLLKLLPVDGDNLLDPEALRRFEFALNVFAGMRGWQAPTMLRANFFEEKYPLQLVSASDSRRLASLRLSDKDRQLFASASSENPTAPFENWLADGMELTYVLLYGFLNSRRNSGPKCLAKLDALQLRQDRIQAAIQKLSSLSFDVWKRLEFRTSDIEHGMVRRLNELMKTFLRDSKSYTRDIEGSVFFPALFGYLKRKSEQLTQSLSGLILSISGARGPLQTTIVECLGLLRQHLEQPEPPSARSEAYFQSMGLKIIDIDKINASRSSAGLGRIYVNGRESTLTHHQCNLMANLELKTRWGQIELSKGEMSRHCFLGPKEVALEYVFVRTKLLANIGDNMRWEDREANGRKEAQQAFSLLCGDSMEIPANVAIGVGINIVHTDLLPHISSLLSLSTVLRKYSGATSVSFGYCYTPAGQTTRVVFKVHADTFVGKQGYVGGSAGCWGLLSAIRGVDRFLISAPKEETIAFCEADGLSFLNSFLQERGHQWTATKYGKPFFDYLYGEGATDILYPREEILRAMARTIPIIPCVPQIITKTNMNIIAQMIEILPDTSDVADEAISVLMAICSNDHQQILTGLTAEYAAPQMTEKQKKFTTVGGLGILENAIRNLQRFPAYKDSIETASIDLLMTHEVSATKTGLLVHWQEWFEFYVENKAWMRRPVGPRFSVFLLKQVHIHFFSSTSFLEPGLEACPCGCDRHLEEAVGACIGVIKMFVRLMLTDGGVTWAQEGMQGPRDCVLFLLWSAQPSSCVSTMAALQELIFTNLCEFLERLTSAHQYLRLLSELTPPLLHLLHQQDCVSLQTGALRVLSLTFRLAVDKKVWLISMEMFLESFYRLLESICDDPSLSGMNVHMVHVLCNEEHRKQTARCSNFLLLLHEEHVNFVGGSGQLSPVARSRTKSLMQTLVSLCSLTWNSALQPVCQIPALISLGWMLTSMEVADDLAQLDVDEVLLALMENESAVVSILAARAYIAFLFQGLSSKRITDEHLLKRLCNLLASVLASGSRLMLSPKRSSNTENADIIQFAPNQPDTYEKLLQYKNLNRENQSRAQHKDLDQDDVPTADSSLVEAIWESNEWNDLNRAMAEKLSHHLKLLVVLSSMTRNVASIGGSDEMRVIVLLLVRLVRERIHSASPHTTLYLLSLKNIVWATRFDIMKWGVSDLTETSFLRKIVLLAKDKLYQDLASRILWGLADAYEKSNIFLLSFEVDDALATGSYFTKKIGFAVMVDNLTSKLAANRSIENDSGAIASMIAHPACSSFFLTNYGYPFVLKLIESVLRMIQAGYTHEYPGLKTEDTPSEIVGEAFGSLLFYSHPIQNQQERELFQLCRAATNVLEALQRISPESVLDEAARTKNTMIPLLDHSNKQVTQYAVLCCSIHLQTHPTQCAKLLENDVQDKVIAFFFDDEFPPIQIAAFSCMKFAFADQKNLVALQEKLFPLRERIVSCLHSSDFEVKRKAIVFLLEALFRLEDQTFLDGVAQAFAAADNRGLLMELFDSISKEIALNPSACSVLQLLVRLIIKLDIMVHTGGDELVHVICHTLKAHSNDTFLRPVLFNFLHQIITQDDHVEFLERRSRLDVITELLSQQLTLSEFRNVANMLLLVATKHDGIRHYLSGFESGCIPKIAIVMNEFSEYSQNNATSEISEPVQGQDENVIEDSNRESHMSGHRLIEMLDEEVAQRLITERQFISMLFSYLTPTDHLFTISVAIRRASSFTLARLAEFPQIHGSQTITASVGQPIYGNSYENSGSWRLPNWKRVVNEGERIYPRYSTAAFERRKCFIDFVIAVGKWDPSLLSVIDVETIVQVVIRNGAYPEAAVTMGREYLILKDICQWHMPKNLDVMMKCFGLGCVDDPQSKPSAAFRMFWNSVYLKLLPVTFTLATKTKVTISDPSHEVGLATIFGVDLLKLLSSHCPLAAKWYAECHGDTHLLDMMLLASKVSALQMQHSLIRSFLSNLLWLANQLLELDHAKYHRIFMSDPRYLRCAVDLIYAPAHEVQMSAIKLVQNLAQQPRLFATLSRLENLEYPLASASTDVISYAGERLTKHQLSPQLSPDCVVLLAHISLVPFFIDLSTTELVKLSLGFRPCSQPAKHCWMILMNDCRFSAVPEWMIGEQSNTTMASFHSAMNRVQKRFEGSLGAHLEKVNVSMFSIDSDAYFNYTSAATRKRVAMRLDNLLKTYIDDSTMYRGSVRARNGLVMRLSRLLVEDRAEIIRRVAYTKRVSERVLFEQMRTQQLSDLLLLLQETPLFEGIQRDHLAKLAFCLGSPVEFVVEKAAPMHNLPLLLLYDESIEFEMHLSGEQEVFRGTVSRGGLFGFPSWMRVVSSLNDVDIITVVHKCGLLGTIISLEVLESELPEQALNMVNDRLRRTYGDGNTQAILNLMGQDTLLPMPNLGRRRLQSSASSLIVQLISADVFVENLLNDDWAIGVIVDVALGALPADVVRDALAVIVAMTATESYTKRFCAQLVAPKTDHAKVKVKVPTTSLWQRVAAFVNRFKLRLWQDHPEILEQFFLVQVHVASYLPAFWANLEDIWTPTYLRTCLALLRSNQSRTAEVVSCHLSCAIPHRLNFLLQCGHSMNLNLNVTHALTRTHSGKIVGMLQLFEALCSDESLCEQVWERVIINFSDAFDEFLYLICASGMNAQLELEFRHATQNRFGILLVLLQRLQELPDGQSVCIILRSIGSMCIDAPSNCNLAATIRDFVSVVGNMLGELENDLEGHKVVCPLVIESLFSCIDVIASASGPSTRFEEMNFVAVALRVIQSLTSPPRALPAETVIALQSVVKVLLRTLTSGNEKYLEKFDIERMSILVAGYKCVSM